MSIAGEAGTRREDRQERRKGKVKEGVKSEGEIMSERNNSVGRESERKNGMEIEEYDINGW